MARELDVLGPFDRRPVDLVFDLDKEPSLTEQSHARECDINNIMKRYENDGLLTHVNTFQGDYGDFTEVQDYHTSMNQILMADEMFMSLPAKIREKFGNDAAKFLMFADDPENEDEMRDMGLLPELVDPNPGGADATDPSPSRGVGDGGTGTGSPPSDAPEGSGAE